VQCIVEFIKAMTRQPDENPILNDAAVGTWRFLVDWYVEDNETNSRLYSADVQYLLTL